MASQLRVGSKVRVPWGVNRDVDGTIVEVWGDPPTHVRVELHLERDDDAEPVVILLSPSALSAA